MPDMRTTASTQFVDAGGIRYTYRRFGRKDGVPLLFMQHFRGGMDHNRMELMLCPDSGYGSLFQCPDLFLSQALLFLGDLER
jgi:hypothetical protein